MKMIKFSIGMLVMPCLLAVSLVCSVIAVFAPYAVEWMLGLSMMGLASFAFCYYKVVNGKLVWRDEAVLLVINHSSARTEKWNSSKARKESLLC